MNRDEQKQPIQPLGDDGKGVIRFKENKLVQYILDKGGIDMNHLAVQEFPQEDREQFAQLIGYSLSGYGDLSYVRDETWEAANRMHEKGETEEHVRVKVLEGKIEAVRKGLKEIIPEVFRMHPDDLEV